MEVHEITSSGAPSPGPEGVSTPPAPDMPVKGKSRHRLIQRIQRISSTPSLSGLRRSRSVGSRGSPYSTRSTLS
ncbi:hypothetical protein FOXYS1_15896, partial [Fusarium oxysporum]